MLRPNLPDEAQSKSWRDHVQPRNARHNSKGVGPTMNDSQSTTSLKVIVILGLSAYPITKHNVNPSHPPTPSQHNPISAPHTQGEGEG
jgi:hypothetical protein